MDKIEVKTPTGLPKLMRHDAIPSGSCYCDPSKDWYAPEKCDIVARQREYAAKVDAAVNAMEEAYRAEYKPKIKPYDSLSVSGRKYRRSRIRHLQKIEKEKDLLSRFRTPQDAQKEQNLAPEKEEGGSVAGGPTIG